MLQYTNETTPQGEGPLGKKRTTEESGQENSPIPADSPQDCNHTGTISQTSQRTARLSPAHRTMRNNKVMLPKLGSSGVVLIATNKRGVPWDIQQTER